MIHHSDVVRRAFVFHRALRGGRCVPQAALSFLKWEPSQRPVMSAAIEYEWLKCPECKKAPVEDIVAGPPPCPPRSSAGVEAPTASTEATQATIVVPDQPSTAPAPASGVQGLSRSAAATSACPPVSSALLLPWSPSPRVVLHADAPCNCSGHCYQPGHRYAGGCSATRVLKPCVQRGSRMYCEDCTCEVPLCFSPRHHGPLCKKHARQVDKLPSLWSFIRGVKHLLPSLLPCDVANFIAVYADIMDDLSMLILVARIKEPACVNALVDCYRRHRATGASVYSASQLRSWLQSMISSVHDCPKHYAAELEQLSKQGVGRIMGAQTVCSVLSLALRRLPRPRSLSR